MRHGALRKVMFCKCNKDNNQFRVNVNVLKRSSIPFECRMHAETLLCVFRAILYYFLFSTFSSPEHYQVDEIFPPKQDTTQNVLSLKLESEKALQTKSRISKDNKIRKAALFFCCFTVTSSDQTNELTLFQN